jgi:predicted permease
VSFWRKLRGLFPSQRAAQEREMQEELESLKAIAGKNELGNLTRVAEDARETWRWNWLETLWQDIRYSARTLRKSPGFTIIAIVVLSLGIGLNLTFLQLINVVFLKPLPVRDPETLVLVNIQNTFGSLTIAAMDELQQNTDVFSATIRSLYLPFDRQVTWQGAPTDTLNAFFVSANWFEELGIQPLRGRLFNDSGFNNADAPPVAVISERYWESRLGKDPSIVGTQVRLNNRPVTIIGIVPRNRGSLQGGREPHVWLPLAQVDYVFSGSRVAAEPTATGRLYGRLRSEISRAEARARLHAVVDRLPGTDLRFGHENHVDLLQASKRFRSPAATIGIWKIIGVCLPFTLLILVITCANLANLVLSRGVGRMHELRIRAALGAARSRIIRYLLAETASLATLAACGALVFAYWGVRLAAFVGSDLFQTDLSFDWRTGAFAILSTVVATAGVGLLPAWTIGKRNLALGSGDGGHQISTGLDRVRQRQILLAAQVAGSCLLLVVAALLLRTLQQMLVPPGFEYENVIVAEQLWRDKAPAFWSNLRQKLDQDPAVESVALFRHAPLQREERVERLESNSRVKFIRTPVEPEFFRVLRIPFLEGKPFSAADAGKQPIVLSKSLATQVYGATSAIGRPFADVGLVVGVVEDAHLTSPEAYEWPEVYTPLRETDYGGMLVKPRARSDAPRLVLEITQTMQNLNARVPSVRLLEADFADRVRGTKILAAILFSLAALALIVSCMGIFGTVSYNVALRRREIGIRVALGARHGSVVLLMIEQLVWPVSMAMIAGIIGGVIVARIFEANGGRFSPPDTPTMTLAALTVLMAVAFSCIVPTLRVLRSSNSRVLSS